MKPVPTAMLIRDYAAGASLTELARRYPLCRSAIGYRLQRAGITLRRCGAPRGNTNARGRRDDRFSRGRVRFKE